MGRSNNSKKKNKKNKGVKGKKAREKAKLDRQWGEHIEESVLESQKIRKGKSRLLLNKSTTNKKQQHYDNNDKEKERVRTRTTNNVVMKHELLSSSSSDEEDEEEDEFMEDSANQSNDWMDPVKSLLHVIGTSNHAKSNHKPNTQSKKTTPTHTDDEEEEEEDDDDEEENDNFEENEEEEERNENIDNNNPHKICIVDNDDDDDDDEDEMDHHPKSNVLDPFTLRFSLPPLPEQTKNMTLPLSNKQQKQQQSPPPPSLTKILTPHLDPSLELYVSKEQQQQQQQQQLSSIPIQYQFIRKVLAQNWNKINASAIKRDADACQKKKKKNKKNNMIPKSSLFSSLQGTLFPSLTQYADHFLPIETRENSDELRSVILLHVLNHILTSRSRIQKHNKRIIREVESEEIHNDDNNDIQQQQQQQKQPSIPIRTCIDTENITTNEDKWRDQGYTRPTVLVLLPTRGTCLKFVHQIKHLIGDSSIMIHNMDRFELEHGVPKDDKDNNDDDDEAEKRRRAVLESKGSDWLDLFGDSVNDDDDFKIGISFKPNASSKQQQQQQKQQKKKKKKKKKHDNDDSSSSSTKTVEVKLYSDFYASDMIISSPIGLKMITTRSGTNNNNNGEQKMNNNYHDDIDFLSSIEICLILHSDVLLLQNWDHVNSIMNCLNHQPYKHQHSSYNTDFSRVRRYMLCNQANKWRQFILVSRFNDPYIQSCFKIYSQSLSGQIRMRRFISNEESAVSNVLPISTTITNTTTPIRQIFQRIPCTSMINQCNDRLKYFTDIVYPQLTSSSLQQPQQTHTLLFIPSYFDFISIRNLFLQKNYTNFVCITEYARISEVSRGRGRFLQGQKSIMLYTGRAHYFKRHRILGVRHVIFYGLPEHAEFYTDIVNWLYLSENNPMKKKKKKKKNDMAEDDDDDDDDDSLMMTRKKSCLVLFTKYDAHALDRIVGTNYCERMLKGEKNAYMFKS